MCVTGWIAIAEAEARAVLTLDRPSAPAVRSPHPAHPSLPPSYPPASTKTPMYAPDLRHAMKLGDGLGAELQAPPAQPVGIWEFPSTHHVTRVP